MTESKKSGEFYYDKRILGPYHHICEVLGKQLRVKIVTAFNHWLKVPKDKLNCILEDVLNILHHGGLLMDDIQDDSVVRRGLPAAHVVFGVPLAMNASLQAIIWALDNAIKIDIRAGKVFANYFLDVVRGQGMDVYWRDNFVCPTETEWKDMSQRKTGASYLLAVHMIQLFSENKTDYTKFILKLGQYFQIRDDYCNLSQQEALEDWPTQEEQKKTTSKDSYCEDLTEGKFTLPIIHALNTPDGPIISNILRQRTRDYALKKYCVSLLEKAGSLQYTRDTLIDLDRTLRAELVRLGGNPEMEAVLDEMLDWRD